MRALLALTVALLAFTASGASVTLAWNHSPDPNVTGYFIHYGTNSGSYTTKTNVGYGSRATVLRLRTGRTYFFAASAYNVAGLESDLSNEVSWKVPIPDPLTNVLLTVRALLRSTELTNWSVKLPADKSSRYFTCLIDGGSVALTADDTGVVTNWAIPPEWELEGIEVKTEIKLVK